MRRVVSIIVVAVALAGPSAGIAWSDSGTLWLDGGGRPSAEARIALSYLGSVEDDGLDPADFQFAGLELLSENPGPAFEQLLTENMLRYMRQLHLGRVDPQAVGFSLPRPPDAHDFAAMLHSGVTEHRLDAMIASLRPPFVQYLGLKNALAAYRRAEPGSPRVRQIELALERLRWLPELEGRLLVVNIPMFRVWGWERERDTGIPAIDMAVVVGRARSTRTPVFTADLTEVIFRPYWNVPASILRNEILPAIARDPGYLQRHDMEMVGGALDAVRVRQRPGPGNALGLAKFSFPNPHDVYMHDTPSTELFRRDRRDFSHGCVRVEDPEGLAVWVLGRQPGWGRAQVVAAMNGQSTTAVRVAEPVRVVMFYMTAAFDPDEGSVRFSDDIYGHDARLDAMLKARAGGGE